MSRNQVFSLTNQLRYGLVSIVASSLLITGSLLTYLSFREQVEQTTLLQQERSQGAANQISAYLDTLQRQLNYLSELRGLTDFTPETQRSILEGLVNSDSAYELVGILNDKGQVVQAISPDEPVSQSRLDLALASDNSPLFSRVFKESKNYFSPVELDAKSNLPVAILAVPIRNRQNQIKGVLFCKINLDFLTQITARTNVGKTGYSYILDNRLVLIAGGRGTAHQNAQKKFLIPRLQDLKTRPFVRELSNLSPEIQPVIVYPGLNGEKVVGTATLVRRVQWMVVVELPVAEAYAPVRWMLVVMGSATLGCTVVAVGLGMAFSRSITIPLKSLRDAASRISSGQFDRRIESIASNELGELATSFNSMAEQLQASFAEMNALNEELLNSERRLTQFVEAMPVGVFVAEANGQPFYMNLRAKQILGQGLVANPSLEELRKTYQAYLAGTEQIYPQERDPIMRAMQGESVYIDDMEIRQSDKIIPIEVWGTPIYDDRGQIAYAIATFADITERKQAEKIVAQYNRTLELKIQERTQKLEQEIAERKQTEKTLRQTEARHRAILAAIPDLMFRVNAEGIYLGFVITNQLLALVPSTSDPVGKHMSEFLPPDVYERQMHYLQQALTTGNVQIYEQQICIHDKLQYEEVRVVVSGEDEVLFMIRDISNTYQQATQRQQAEDALRQTNEELMNALQQLKATQNELIQSEKMAALGQLVAGIAHEINTPLGAIRASISNITIHLEQSLQHLPQLFQKLSPARQADFLTLLDTARNHQPILSTREERQLRRTLKQELAARGFEDSEMIASFLAKLGITQDITPFLPLLQDENQSLILDVAYSLWAQQTNSRTIGMAVERASKVVFALKSYVRQDNSGQMTQVQVTAGIDIVLTLYHNQLKQGIEVIKHYQDIPPILCYPEELNQVWTNLIHNAIQAMNNKGTLELDAFVTNHQVVVQITDSGCGISPEIKTQIFQPFFTTKPSGEGSGLGLDIVRKIIDKHRGKIEVSSVPGRTTFTVSLPI